MAPAKKPQFSARTEIVSILKGILLELLRIASAGKVNPRITHVRKAPQRLIGATFQDEQGRTIKVIAKDSEVEDRYIVQRSDGRYFGLYKRTIKRYLEDV